MISRHKAREIALQILYRYDLAQKTTVVRVESLLIDELRGHYEHFRVSEELRPFVGELVAGTMRSLTALDSILEKHTAHWKISRLSSVDRCILRMAVFEMIQFPQMPRAVIIDEAIELAKSFGTEESPSFVNGVLDQVIVPGVQKVEA